MTTLYQWVIFVHVASVLLLLLVHGTALTVTNAVRGEVRRERLVALLDLSQRTFDSRHPLGRIFWLSLVAAAVSGVALMVMGNFWRQIWPWASMVLLIGAVVGMTHIGSRPMAEVRRAAGRPFIVRRGIRRPEWHEPQEADEVALSAALERVRPRALNVLGFGSFALVLWLMLFQPF